MAKSKLIALIPILTLALGLFIGSYILASPHPNSIPAIIQGGSLAQLSTYTIFGEDIDGDSIYDITYAKYGLTGEIKYNGTDAGLVIQSSLNALPSSGGSIFIREGIYPVNSQITIPIENVLIQGSGWGTELRAASSIPCLLNASSKRFIIMNDICLNGYGYATVTLDLSQPSSRSIQSRIQNCRIMGATTYNILIECAEDFWIIQCYVDGRKSEVENYPTTNYGIFTGKGRNIGCIYLTETMIAFHDYADLYINNTHKAILRECTIPTHVVSGGWNAPNYQANIIIEGVSTEEWPVVIIENCWLEGGGDNVPNIKIVGYKAVRLTIMNSKISNDGTCNINSTLNPALETLEIFNSRLEHTGSTEPHIDIYVDSAYIRGTYLTPSAGGLNKAKATRYSIQLHYLPSLTTSNLWSYGTTSATNGAWITHGLCDTPTTIILTVEAYNITAYIIAKNTTHFQIGLYYTTTGTAVAASTTVHWMAIKTY